MAKRSSVGSAVFVAWLASVSASPVAAASAVTFVSGAGRDAGACTRVAPCRSFRFAFTRTTAGGVLAALDSANYGPVQITRSITIVGTGKGAAAINLNKSTTNAGIDIQASGATVILRGLEIDGGAYGINIGQAATVVISDSVIVGSSSSAVYVNDTAASVLVQDTTARNAPVDTNAATFVAKRVAVSGSSTSGIRLFAGRSVLDDCTISGSGGTNVGVFNTSIVKQGVFPSASLRGIAVDPNGTAYVDSSTTFGNGQVGILSAGQTYSYGNNNFPEGTSGTITPIAGD